MRMQDGFTGLPSGGCASAGRAVVVGRIRLGVVVSMSVNAMDIVSVLRNHMQKQRLRGVHGMGVQGRRRRHAEPGDQRGHQHGKRPSCDAHDETYRAPGLYGP